MQQSKSLTMISTKQNFQSKSKIKSITSPSLAPNLREKQLKNIFNFNDLAKSSNYQRIQDYEQFERLQKEHLQLAESMSHFYSNILLRSDSYMESSQQAQRIAQLSTTLLFQYIKTMYLQKCTELTKLQEVMKQGFLMKHPTPSKQQMAEYQILKQNQRLKENIKSYADLLAQTQKHCSQLQHEKSDARNCTLSIIDNFKRNAEKLMGMYQSRESDIEALRIHLQQKQIEIRTLQDKLRNFKQAKQMNKLLEQKYFNDIYSHRKALEKQCEQKNKAQKRHTQARIEATLNQEKIQYLMNQVKSFKTMFYQQKNNDKQLDRFKELVNQDSTNTEKKNIQINCLKARLNEKDLQLEKIRTQYKSLLEQYNIHLKQTKSKQKAQIIGAPPALLNEYKIRCQQKDKQINDLTKRFKKYNLADQRGVLQLKQFSKKEQQYEQVIRQLKHKVNRFENAQNQQNSSQSSQDEAGKSDEGAQVCESRDGEDNGDYRRENNSSYDDYGDDDDRGSKLARKYYGTSPKVKSYGRVKERGVVLRGNVLSVKRKQKNRDENQLGLEMHPRKGLFEGARHSLDIQSNRKDFMMRKKSIF